MLSQRIVQLVVPSACCIALAACANLTVRTDQNPNLSVAQCHTYSFAKEYVANADQPAAYGNPLNADRLRAAIEANLSSPGFSPPIAPLPTAWWATLWDHAR